MTNSSDFVAQKQKELLKLKIEYLNAIKRNPLLVFQLMPMQKRIVDDQNITTRAVLGGNRSSKSQVITYDILKYCMEHPGSKCWAVSETFQDSINIQQSKLWKLADRKSVV